MRLAGLLYFCALGSLLAPACVFDPNDRCSPHQVQFSNDRCVCEPGYVPGKAGCVPCPEHELEANGACVCDEGYARPADGAACELIPAELGAACDTEAAPCPAGQYPLCHVTDGTSGYCTAGCDSDDDCDGGYRCHEDGADSFCRRPPTGYGDHCETDDDCAGGEATYCEIIQQNVCLVPCGAGKTDGCFEGEVCCNFVVFEPICVPGDQCSANGGTEVE